VRYVATRLANGIIVVFIVTLIVFGIVALLPGDPAETMLGQSAPPQAVQAIREHMGLNQPIPLRYVRWIGGVLHGDLGNSAQGGQPVANLIKDASGVTLELTVLALVIAILISLPFGIVAAVMPKSIWGGLISLWTYLALSMPAFWLGIVLILVFAVRLNLFPAVGYVSPGDDLGANLHGMVLPAFTLGFVLSAPLTRYLRASMIAELTKDYVLAAEMKGLTRGTIIVRHVLRNALVPYVTAIGIQFAWLIGGAVIVEVLFALPGMGRLAVQSVFDRDYFIVQGVVLVVALGVLVTSFVIDILYVVLDPRVRLGATAGA
jgi:peptide/nickel transport system permease protein